MRPPPAPLETAALEYIVRRWMQWIDLYCAVYFQGKAGLWYLSPVYIKLQWKYAARPPRSLCDFAAVQKKKKTPGGEVFVRSFVSHYPEGFSVAYFFCSKSPGYTSVIALLSPPTPQTPPAPPSPTRRHRWHWLRCAKNLLMCLNYLRLMLGAKRLQQCPGTALFLWWKFFEDHSFASYFVALPREMPRGSEAIRNTLINS